MVPGLPPPCLTPPPPLWPALPKYLLFTPSQYQVVELLFYNYISLVGIWQHVFVVEKVIYKSEHT